MATDDELRRGEYIGAAMAVVQGLNGEFVFMQSDQMRPGGLLFQLVLIGHGEFKNHAEVDLMRGSPFE